MKTQTKQRFIEQQKVILDQYINQRYRESVLLKLGKFLGANLGLVFLGYILILLIENPISLGIICLFTLLILIGRALLK